MQKEKKWPKRFASYYDDDKRFNRDDPPVIATWYAARAYCLWLSLPESDRDVFYRLPKEIEWEFAASGEEERPCPWPKERGKPTSKLANYNSNEGASTPVGRYPEGATPESLLDEEARGAATLMPCAASPGTTATRRSTTTSCVFE